MIELINSYIHLVPTLLIGVVYPFIAITTGHKTRSLLSESPHLKVYIYKYTMITQVILILLITGAMQMTNDQIKTIGLLFLGEPIWLLLGIASCFLAFWLFNKISLSANQQQKLLKQYEDVVYIMPTNAREFKYAIMLSIVAGTLEEVIFRGYLFWQMSQIMPLFPAIIVVNVVFGLSHYGTKAKNSISAFLLGMVASTLYYFTGSLLLPMVMHVIVDFYSMIMAKKLFADQKPLNKS